MKEGLLPHDIDLALYIRFAAHLAFWRFYLPLSMLRRTRSSDFANFRSILNKQQPACHRGAECPKSFSGEQSGLRLWREAGCAVGGSSQRALPASFLLVVSPTQSIDPEKSM